MKQLHQFTFPLTAETLKQHRCPTTEQWIKGESESHSVVSDCLRPYGLYSPWNPLGQNTRAGNLSLLQGNLPNSEIKPRSLTLQADSLPAEPQGKPKNTGVGSLSLLQGIFPTQKLNQGLLHCRQILYQLSYQGSPNMWYTYTMEYYSAIKKNDIMPFDMAGHRDYHTKWSKSDKDQYHMIMFTCRI